MMTIELDVEALEKRVAVLEEFISALLAIVAEGGPEDGGGESSDRDRWLAAHNAARARRKRERRG